MKTLVVFLLTTFAIAASAYVVPTYRDIKPASQVMLEKQDFGQPIVATTNYIKTTYAGPTSAAAVTLSTFTHQPDVPRNLTITPTGTTGDVESCAIVVTGTNILNKVQTETFTFSANDSSAQTGTKAFKTVTSVTWPANCESGSFAATWIIGVSEKLGIKRCMSHAGDFAWSEADGVYSATRPTIAVDASVVGLNTADFAETMDASVRFIGYFIQNFACLP